MVSVLAFPPGQFTRNKPSEDLFLFSWWEEEQNDPEGAMVKLPAPGRDLNPGVPGQPHGVLGLPGRQHRTLHLWCPSCRWFLLTAVSPPSRTLSLALSLPAPHVGPSCLPLVPIRNGGAEDRAHGRGSSLGKGWGQNGHDEHV